MARFPIANSPGLPRAPLSRRRLLQIGGLGSLGLTLPRLLQAEEAGATAGVTHKPIKACILLFYYGGPSQLDTWDMKPLAPAEVRGEFQSIATRVPGVHISEHLPHSAQVMDKLAVVRSMRHPMRNHNAAAVEALCGRTPLRGDLELLANDPATDFPCFGSAVAHQLAGQGNVPPYVALPHVMYNVVMPPGQTAGFLGVQHEPLRIESDPNSPAFRVPELELPAELSLAELDSRQRLLQAIDAQTATQDAALRAGVVASGSAQSFDGYYERAFSLLHSEAVRRAVDLRAEPDAMRDRYGRTKHGQSVLLARRLVEAGVRFVSVYDHVRNGLENWDTHVDNFTRLKNDLLPPADRALAALVGDLDERGLLDSTLIVWLGEFGRTPKINAQARGGRDHWPDCFSVVLAGGGTIGGASYGESDKIAAYPARDPVSPGDLAATIFWRFGLDPERTLFDAAGRGYRLAEGTPLRALFA